MSSKLSHTPAPTAGEKSPVESSRKRGDDEWTETQTSALLQITLSLEANRQAGMPDGSFWDHVARRLSAEHALARTASECKKRYKEVAIFDNDGEEGPHVAEDDDEEEEEDAGDKSMIRFQGKLDSSTPDPVHGAAAPIDKRLQGKVAIVTGGARGIGEAIVRMFVEHGARVVIADIDDTVGEALAAALGPQACAFEHCDVSVEADVERAVQSAVARHGRLDVFCNNAGVLGRQTIAAKRIASMDSAEFERVLRVNALGAAHGMKHAARASIVSVASVVSVARRRRRQHRVGGTAEEAAASCRWPASPA
ncbi:hypothetical protein EJB05_38755, partial [Eragrostis curvula]